jgi:hypothetical protein
LKTTCRKAKQKRKENMNAQKTYQLLRTDVLLGTDLNCYNSLISLDHRMKIKREREVPHCSKCLKILNFNIDVYLDTRADEYICAECFIVTPNYKSTTTKHYGFNLHFRDYLKKESL